MFEYLLLNLVIISFPLMATFYPKIAYWRRLPAVFISIFIVGAFFVAWDVLFTAWGFWSFNPRYVLGAEIFGLPFEEILFFVSVPYSCLFVYESLVAYSAEGRVPFDRRAYLAAGILCLILSAVFMRLGYTSVMFGIAGLFLLYAAFRLQELLSSRRYWIFVGITLFLFVVFNYVLTSLPVVVYSGDAIIGFRVGTIPAEDFLYNYSMLSMYLAVYLWSGSRIYPQKSQFLMR